MSNDTFQSTIEQLSIVMNLPREEIADIIKRILLAYRDEQERSFEQVKTEGAAVRGTWERDIERTCVSATKVCSCSHVKPTIAGV